MSRLKQVEKQRSSKIKIEDLELGLEIKIRFQR